MRPADALVVGVSLALTFAGLILLTFVIGISTGAMEELMHRARDRPVALRAHTVVLGFGPSTPYLLGELADIYAKNLKSVKGAVLGAHERAPDAFFDRRLRGYEYRSGNPEHAADLERVGIAEAKRVLVLGEGGEPDARVIATLYRERDLKALVDTFESQIYPRNREFFGSEWVPGVDADPRLYILYASGLGESVAGYFSSADQYLPQVREDSNGHEMLLINADHGDLAEEFSYGLQAHEFQHMIHWYTDRNEETWMNEGFSDLAMLLNGYTIGGMDRAYVQTPDIQLTDWPSDPTYRTEHYGAAFLFLTYFLDRFGEDATKALVAEPANGMVSIDKVLASLGATDSSTGKPIGADDVFADWVVPSFLEDGRVADGRYTYHNYSSAPDPDVTEVIENCPVEPGGRVASSGGSRSSRRGAGALPGCQVAGQAPLSRVEVSRGFRRCGA